MSVTVLATRSTKTLDWQPDRLGDAIVIPSVTLKEGKDIFLENLYFEGLGCHFGRAALRVEAAAPGLVSAALGHHATTRSA